MNENNLDKVLVENNKGKIIGIIDETNLLKGVMKYSFKSKVTKYVTTKFKTVSHKLNFKSLFTIFKKVDFVFVNKNRNFIGIISRNDLLCYLKRNPYVKK